MWGSGGILPHVTLYCSSRCPGGQPLLRAPWIGWVGYRDEVDVSDNRNICFALRAVGSEYLIHSTRQFFIATRAMESVPPGGRMTRCKHAFITVFLPLLYRWSHCSRIRQPHSFQGWYRVIIVRFSADILRVKINLE